MTTLTVDSAHAVAHFRARLAFETDASDVQAARAAGEPLVIVDTRGDAAWAQGRLPGAVHIPHRDIPARIAEIPDGAQVVVYCWGPGCNAATRGALAFAEHGILAREMIGGFEYWVREGLDVETDAGVERRPTDPLTGPSTLPVCDC